VKGATNVTAHALCNEPPPNWAATGVTWWCWTSTQLGYSDEQGKHPMNAPQGQ
jgi:hypothetical protein